MIAVYARYGDERAEHIRTELLRAFIPCILIGPEYGFSDIVERIPYVIVTDEGELFSSCFKRSLPTKKNFTFSPDVNLADLVHRKYLEQYGIDIDFVYQNNIRYANQRVYFRGNTLRFTKNERRILNLLMFCGDAFFSAEEVAAFCLQAGKGDAAAVHICNMNAKALQECGAKIIQCRRFRGYRIKPQTLP